MRDTVSISKVEHNQGRNLISTSFFIHGPLQVYVYVYAFTYTNMQTCIQIGMPSRVHASSPMTMFILNIFPGFHENSYPVPVLSYM